MAVAVAARLVAVAVAGVNATTLVLAGRFAHWRSDRVVLVLECVDHKLLIAPVADKFHRLLVQSIDAYIRHNDVTAQVIFADAIRHNMCKFVWPRFTQAIELAPETCRGLMP